MIFRGAALASHCFLCLGNARCQSSAALGLGQRERSCPAWALISGSCFCTRISAGEETKAEHDRLIHLLIGYWKKDIKSIITMQGHSPAC